jgi:MFS family permease
MGECVSRKRDSIARPAGAPRFVLGRRAAFIGVAYAFAVTMLGVALPTPLYPLFAVEFGFSLLTLTVIFATFAVGVIVALLLFGRLSDQIGRRLTLLPGLGLSALSAVSFLLAQGVGMLLVGRMLSGLSAGIFMGAATATLVDLAPEARGRATLVATMVSVGGVGSGPLLTGLLSQFAPSPLQLTFEVDLVLLVPAAVFVWAMPEPVAAIAHPRVRPQKLRIPSEMRAVFVRASLAAFAGFAVLGLFTAVAPGFLSQILGITNRAIVGLVVFSVFAASTVGQTVLMRIFGSGALRGGCGGLIAGMGLLAVGLNLASLALVIAGAVVAGFGQGLSFRAGLAAVNEAAPADRRGEVASSYFVVAYVALSLPVVGVGVLAGLTNLRVASVVFAALVAALAATVLVLLTRGPHARA